MWWTLHIFWLNSTTGTFCGTSKALDTISLCVTGYNLMQISLLFSKLDKWVQLNKDLPIILCDHQYTIPVIEKLCISFYDITKYIAHNWNTSFLCFFGLFWWSRKCGSHWRNTVSCSGNSYFIMFPNTQRNTVIWNKPIQGLK